MYIFNICTYILYWNFKYLRVNTKTVRMPRIRHVSSRHRCIFVHHRGNCSRYVETEADMTVPNELDFRRRKHGKTRFMLIAPFSLSQMSTWESSYMRRGSLNFYLRYVCRARDARWSTPRLFISSVSSRALTKIREVNREWFETFSISSPHSPFAATALVDGCSLVILSLEYPPPRTFTPSRMCPTLALYFHVTSSALWNISINSMRTKGTDDCNCNAWL